MKSFNQALFAARVVQAKQKLSLIYGCNLRRVIKFTLGWEEGKVILSCKRIVYIIIVVFWNIILHVNSYHIWNTPLSVDVHLGSAFLVSAVCLCVCKYYNMYISYARIEIVFN